MLEPILVEGDVDVVLSGHEHLYERLLPQRGISYFTSGGAGSLRLGDLAPSTVHAKGFDTDYHFMLMEVSGNELFFQAISRTGQTVDAGVISRPGTWVIAIIPTPNFQLPMGSRHPGAWRGFGACS